MVFINYIQLDYISFFVEIFLFILSIVLLMFGVFLVSMREYRYVTLVREFHYTLILIFFFAILLLMDMPVVNQVIFNNLLLVDPLVLNVKIILLVTVICCLLVSFNYIKKEKLS